jgi:hypothetical protein
MKNDNLGRKVSFRISERDYHVLELLAFATQNDTGKPSSVSKIIRMIIQQRIETNA